MGDAVFSQMSYPNSAEGVFDRIVTLGWYDGIMSGIASSFSPGFALRFDILAWGPGQERRAFTLSPIGAEIFNEAVRILSRMEPPKWPRWDAPWPRTDVEKRKLGRELETILANFERPEFVIETDSMFKTIFAAKKLSGSALGLIPEHFEAYPHLDNFEYWQQFLGTAP